MSVNSGDPVEKVVSTAEDVADSVLRRSKNYLPHLARLCLISTFLEDGIRMWFQWREQRDYVNVTWHCGMILANMFVFVNMTAQLTGCIMILLRKMTTVAVGILFGTIVLQSCVYTVLWDFKFFLRNLALTGALLLVLAEANTEVKTMFAGLPSMGKNQKQSYMQLAGRVLVVFMFLTLIKFELSVFRLIMFIIGAALMVCVFVGFKTKLASLVLVALLMIVNITYNAFWSVSSHSIMRDFMRFDFFQTLSVVGGLLYLVALGPGGVSLDERKRE